jgi:hypothetical protein
LGSADKSIKIQSSRFTTGKRSVSYFSNMKLAHDAAMARLAAHDHGVLCTVHPERGVDAVPVVFALSPDGYVGVPIDLVKPKASLRLQRERNLEADPRATMLIEHWDADDWTRLWWVRAELRWVSDLHTVESEVGELLATRYKQYREQPFARILLFEIGNITGWSGSS